MKKICLAVAVVGSLVGCAGDPATNEVGITYRTVGDSLVEGTFVTAYGSVEFKSEVVADGVVDITFDRGRGAFGSHVDWTTLTNDLVYPAGYAITDDDRFLLKALSTAIENDLGNTMPAADNLIRQTNVWGHHPAGPVTTTQIVADAERGWIKLCGVSAYTFSHDASSHGQQSEYLACGKTEKSNPCRDRCGPGCTAAWGSSAWTRDCGNHDRCEQQHASSSCADEFGSASDDFSFAPNC